MLINSSRRLTIRRALLGWSACSRVLSYFATSMGMARCARREKAGRREQAVLHVTNAMLPSLRF
jgi:hypothetical protein